MRVPELAITYDTGRYRFDKAHRQAYLDRYAIFRNNKQIERWTFGFF
jgi:hypothetical protein